VDGLCESGVELNRTRYFLEAAGKVPLIGENAGSQDKVSLSEPIIEIDGFLGSGFCLRMA
jgi:hypothetical protein